MKRLAAAVAAVACLIVAAPASADITQTGNRFTAQPSYCSCVSTIGGWVFQGIPYSPFVRDSFLRLPAGTPTAVDLYFDLGLYRTPLPPVTSVSTTIEVGGTVDPQ